jgi:peptidoglycan/xylan/chitin deacetylase (PgdA/CDA1 family)
MLTILKEVMCTLFRVSGIPFLVTQVWARRHVAILLYHDPSPEILENHLKYLSRHFQFISLDLLVDAITTKNWAIIPQHSLVITFDDGYAGNYDLLKVFRKYGLRPTIYLCSQIINSQRRYWFKGSNKPKSRLKLLPNDVRIRMLVETFGHDIYAEYPDQKREALNLVELLEMASSVDYGSHSMYHPILPTCDDHECMWEISTSKIDLQNLLNTECRHFSFPNGDYTTRELYFVRRAGYISARTTDVGWNHRKTNPFQLKIVGIYDQASVSMMIAQLTGLPGFIRYLLSGSFNGKKPQLDRTERSKRRPRARDNHGSIGIG